MSYLSKLAFQTALTPSGGWTTGAINAISTPGTNFRPMNTGQIRSLTSVNQVLAATRNAEHQLDLARQAGSLTGANRAIGRMGAGVDGSYNKMMEHLRAPPKVARPPMSAPPMSPMNRAKPATAGTGLGAALVGVGALGAIGYGAYRAHRAMSQQRDT